MESLIRHVWELAFGLWEHMNKALHDGAFVIFEQEEWALRKSVRRERRQRQHELQHVIQR